MAGKRSRFMTVALKNHNSNGLPSNNGNPDKSKTNGLAEGCLREGELLLQEEEEEEERGEAISTGLALNGFVLVVTGEGIIFYCSHTIQDYLGFHQTDVMHQNVFELIHTEDQQAFRRNLHWALNPPPTNTQADESPEDGDSAPSMSLVMCNPDQLPPENSSFLERSFVCRFRCLLDNSSGFLALNLQGRLKFLHGQNHRLDDGGQVPPQLALFAIATPLQPPSIMEIRTKNMIFRTKHKLDFTPMACDAKGKIVLGYTEAELRVRGSGYQFIHAADMLYCAENHVRMIKTGESGLTVFRLLTKDNRWKWVQANARLVYKNGKPDYIIATQRPLVEEEGGEHLRKRSMHLPFTFATGEALLYQTNYPMPGVPDMLQGKCKNNKTKKSKVDKNSKDEVDPGSLLGAMMRQDESVYVCQAALEPRMSFHSSIFSEQGETSTFSTSTMNGSWNPVQNGVTTISNPESLSFDPLLATLDSLSLENEESCSNSELFNALENLGLNAEDLELLLLDERMIQVEMEQDYIPSLNDILTNNEILSYVQDSLENQNGDSRDVKNPITVLNSSEPSETQPELPLQPYSNIPHAPYWPQESIPPILHLSQRMQQHFNGQSVCHKSESWIQAPLPQVSTTACETNKFNQPDASTADSVPVVQNGHWVPESTQANLNPQLCDNTKSKAQSHQWQNQSVVSFQSKTIEGGDDIPNGVYHDPHWDGYSYTEQLVTNRPCFSSGQSAHSMDTHIDYNMIDNSGVEFKVNGTSTEDVGQFHEATASSSTYQQGYQKQQQPKLTPTYYTTYTKQNSSLEHILGLAPTTNLPPLSDYSSELTHDMTHSKVSKRVGHTLII
ncbi:hypothetical protein DNTS_021677 [Danionella cerebrum]|uniref:PAS domain-containing protein n=1 Tax=Danionella cerebrum TaxID=2873325 RepID=A0A553NWG6_9TELE|nr:hypothetical protein DNTS_021677 [Danionella translucida]